MEEGILETNAFVCPHCGHHYRVTAQERLKLICDTGTFQEFYSDVLSTNAIGFPGYDAKLMEAQKSSGSNEAVITGLGEVGGRKVVFAVMTFKFMGGSMGSVVGEKIARAVLLGAENRQPVILFTTSGGARMQEGIFSLMQMAKTSAAIAQLDAAGVPLLVVLTDPTYGGVTASFAMLGDVIIAEPGAMVGFAGPRVIEGTMRQKLPDGFQTAEFLMEKGFIDAVVPRSDMKRVLGLLLDTNLPNKARIRL
ncbi:MAG: acetyl-CoA carboxylase subunit beta [Spirochaetes bacterium GWB1_48_6]|nr:MAG: acetyl-CoA carboxylase subunit beta [Spirochaetes bacterium GWB1_48_6]